MAGGKKGPEVETDNRIVHYAPDLEFSGYRAVCGVEVVCTDFGMWTFDARKTTCPVCAKIIIRSLRKVAKQ